MRVLFRLELVIGLFKDLKILDIENIWDIGLYVFKSRLVCNIVGGMGEIMICEYLGIFW